MVGGGGGGGGIHNVAGRILMNEGMRIFENGGIEFRIIYFKVKVEYFKAPHATRLFR